MYISYELYRTTQIKTARQQREEDIRTGEMAAEFGRLWHSVTARRDGGRRDGGRRGFRQAPEIEMLTDARAACSGPSAGPGTICR
jgi:hypothetical protein